MNFTIEKIEEILRTSAIFSELLKAGEADYRLEIFVRHVIQKESAFKTTVMVFTSWTLTAFKSHNVVWNSFISTQYTAAYGHLPHGWTRLKMAQEGAVRENIKKGIAGLQH